MRCDQSRSLPNRRVDIDKLCTLARTEANVHRAQVWIANFGHA